MYCSRCDQKRLASRDDPAFCQDCFDRIEAMVQNPMKYAEAAVAYVNHRANAHNQAELEVYAFLSVFHPEMAHAQKRQLSRGNSHG